MNSRKHLPTMFVWILAVLILTACGSSEPADTLAPDSAADTQVPPVDTAAASPTALPTVAPTEPPPVYQTYTIAEDLGYSLNVADLNGDSYPDILVADSASDVIMLLYNKGDGTFQEPVEIATGQEPRGVDGADLDGDSHTDVLVFHSPEDQAGKLSVLLNNGDGTFQKQMDYATVDSWWGLPVDLDDDTDLDLVIADGTDKENQGGVLGPKVWLNNGDGTFQEGDSYFSGLPNFASMHVADLNGDTYPDLAIRHYPDAMISLLLGIGDGSFGEPVTSEATDRMHGFIIAELNGDSHNDLAWVNQFGLVSVLINKGDATFEDRLDVDIGGEIFAIVAVDMDGDASLDLMIGPTSKSMVSLLANNGDGAFVLAKDYYFKGAWAHAFVVSDVNRDGKPDLVGWDENSVYVFPLNDDS